MAAGETGRPSFRLNRRGVRALTRNGRLRLTMTRAVRAGNGTPVTRDGRLTIRMP